MARVPHTTQCTPHEGARVHEGGKDQGMTHTRSMLSMQGSTTAGEHHCWGAPLRQPPPHSLLLAETTQTPKLPPITSETVRMLSASLQAANATASN